MPEPPSTTLLPRPLTVIASSPALPSRISLPVPVVRVSLPAPPISVLSPLVPVKTWFDVDVDAKSRAVTLLEEILLRTARYSPELV